mgnify:CR=1 FL=1
MKIFSNDPRSVGLDSATCIAGPFSGTTFPGKNGTDPLFLDTNHFYVHFHSDGSNNAWGVHMVCVAGTDPLAGLRQMSGLHMIETPHPYPDNMNQNLGKAGRKRHLGKRPSVRGVVMNPVDHPHGGGEGKSSGGRHPVTPWGKKTRGPKTRNNKATDRLIIRRRHKK